LLELALLDAVRCKKCNAFAFQVLGHLFSPCGVLAM
jgi:hypothetical protein